MSVPASRLAEPGGLDRSAPDPGGREKLYIHAGQVAVVGRPTAISTVLGSCVAVCLYDVRAGIGGMNHFLLPHHVAHEKSARFGTVAVPDLIDRALQAGASVGGLKAKVFGGASVIGAFRHKPLGQENAALALGLLDERGIEVVLYDVGGERGRKLIFHSDDGSAWVRQL